MTLDDFSEGERLDEIKAHLLGPTTSPLFLLDACRWLGCCDSCEPSCVGVHRA
jgi:hypothetical protein